MSLPTSLSQHIIRRPQRIALLAHIAEQGSITRAAKSAGLSYKAAWDAIDELNNMMAQKPLVERSVGGKGGGGAKLTAEGERVLRLYQRLQVLQAEVLGSDEAASDFNLLGRTYRVTAQADAPFRNTTADIANLKTRSNAGAMVPIGAVATLRDDSGPARVVRYNLYPASELQGQAAPGVSSGQALASMEQLAEATLPPGFSYEWTELALQQQQASGGATGVFVLAVVFVFLVLAALYEAFTLPLAVVLIVPMCILAAMIGVNLRGLDNNILVQIGLVVLIALAAKNAILIVEFAKQAEEEGMNRWDAAVSAARTRLRPILMTSFAFIFGVVPLMIATGPGSEMRQSLGTAVFSGMLGVTLFGLIFTPVFYVVSRWAASKLPTGRGRGGGTPSADPVADLPAATSPSVTARPGDL